MNVIWWAGEFLSDVFASLREEELPRSEMSNTYGYPVSSRGMKCDIGTVGRYRFTLTVRTYWYGR